MAKHGKKYRAVLEKIESDKLYSIDEACSLIKDTSVTKFDSSVEVHMNLGINPKHAEQQLRDTVVLPHGTGKEVRVVAFVSDDKVKEATDAGAVKAGNDDLVAEIEKGWMDFDVAVATPDMMKSLGKIARVLGQKGLMPNPKAGTVTPDVAKTIEEIKKGKVEFRNDKAGNLHNMIGKVSFSAENLAENLKTYLKTITDHKPKDLKGIYIKSITLTTTMGPAIKIDTKEAAS
ncbi:MAG: 50S ribosomal protein L1 [Patescibacteria group bacterium]|nr:50S ribosomal protein L1 [Patescibacteria group bacterium]